MCGIGGVIAGSRPVDAEAIGGRMIASLRHRGPEAAGIRTLPGERGIFAHTRLKIIDLSERASQPFASEDGRTFLTFNGEIYNFKTLRAQLEMDGVRFRSSSDTEVVLEQYRRHGLRGLDALDGMFAFAIWDVDRARLLLARDRFGKKPLYWAAAPDGALVFGSEVKALAAYPGLALELEPRHLPEYLVYGYVGTPRSIYKSVARVPPASRLVFERGSRSPQIERYWSLPAPVNPAHAMSIPEAKDAVRSAIGRAVERRMIADVPLGAFLSGGIDSSVVVAEMAKRSSEKVRTFAVGFDDDSSYDETRYAREVADLLGTDHTEIRVRASPSDLLEKLLYHHDEPYGDSSALAVFAVAQATKPHVTVVLTGDGGDEIFAGYTRFRGGLLSDFVPAKARHWAKRALSALPSPRGYKHPLALLQRFVEHDARTPDEQLLAWNAYFVGAGLGSLLRPDVFGAGFDPWSVLAEQAAILAEARARGSDRLDQILRHNIETYLLDDLLVKVDRMTMAVALEARSPFLDRDLAELAFSIPSRIKLRFGRLKWLLREAYRDVLPPSVLDRKKHGFGVPVSRWWSNELKPMLGDLLLDRRARSYDYLDAAAIRTLIKEHQGGRSDHGQRIFALVQLELWLRALESTEPLRPRPAAEWLPAEHAPGVSLA